MIVKYTIGYYDEDINMMEDKGIAIGNGFAECISKIFNAYGGEDKVENFSINCLIANDDDTIIFDDDFKMIVEMYNESKT